jgi:hypothetical protein
LLRAAVSQEVVVVNDAEAEFAGEALSVTVTVTVSPALSGVVIENVVLAGIPPFASAVVLLNVTLPFVPPLPVLLTEALSVAFGANPPPETVKVEVLCFFVLPESAIARILNVAVLALLLASVTVTVTTVPPTLVGLVIVNVVPLWTLPLASVGLLALICVVTVPDDTLAVSTEFGRNPLPVTVTTSPVAALCRSPADTATLGCATVKFVDDVALWPPAVTTTASEPTAAVVGLVKVIVPSPWLPAVAPDVTVAATPPTVTVNVDDALKP